MIKAAVMGYGTIGSGVVEIIEKNNEVLAKRIGDSIEVKSVLDLRDFEDDPIQSKIVHDYKEIVSDPEISIVVETMGGVEPAFTFVKAMLESGKSVCSSNKALVADKGAELFKTARENHVSFLYEASVGGGIPIIRPIHNALTAEVILEISGILNGTTNYMLTKMTEEGCEYEEVLKDAQAKGYAEKDPAADVEGFDACRKIAILTSLISGKTVDYKEIYTEGISKITAIDIKYAKAMGRAIKLIASGYASGESYVAMVAPYLVPVNHPLYQVKDVFNAVLVKGNMLGDSMFYGSGAGKLPTASAVVADIVDIAQRPGRTIDMSWSEEVLKLADCGALENRFFVRTSKSKDEVRAVFGDVEIVTAENVADEVGFITMKMADNIFEKKRKVLGGILGSIRLKD